ncbi:MAG TPA: VTT domain-containing protein [Acidimicrobiales bacterium]|nr:VTT domain-containing protein [Acidimicrobiales bacterium]
MDVLNPEHLLRTFGLIGLCLVVFAESGLMVGFFLPGDSLLITAGLFAARGDLSLPVILVGVFVAAVVGDQVGYAFGHKVGPSLFNRPDSRFFKRAYLDRTQGYFEKKGPRTVVAARFIPIVRTFAPIVAGMSAMRYRTFAAYNVVGGLLWGVGVTTLGYVLGKAFDVEKFNLDKYLLPALAVIVAASFVPVVLEVRRERRRSRSTTTVPERR